MTFIFSLSSTLTTASAVVRAVASKHYFNFFALFFACYWNIVQLTCEVIWSKSNFTFGNKEMRYVWDLSTVTLQCIHVACPITNPIYLSWSESKRKVIMILCLVLATAVVEECMAGIFVGSLSGKSMLMQSSVIPLKPSPASAVMFHCLVFILLPFYLQSRGKLFDSDPAETQCIRSDWQF